MSDRVLNLTRNQLQAMTPNARALRALEQLIKQVGDLLPTDVATLTRLIQEAELEAGNAQAAAYEALSQLGGIVQDAAINAGTADAKATQALDALQRLVNLLELSASQPAQRPSAVFELADASVSLPTAGNLLIYDATLRQWKNALLTAGTNVSITNADGAITINSSNPGGTVTSVGLSAPTGFSVGGSPVTSSGTLALSFASGYSLPTNASQTNWDTAYTDRLKWDGGSTGLNASTGRASLGLVIGTDVQAYSASLANIAALVGTSGLLMKTGANTWALDTTAYGTGSVTSVAMTVPTGFSVSGTPITTNGTFALTFAAGYALPTTASQANWDTAYSDRLKWDGGSTGLVAATGRTSLGATTLGANLFTITNPSAVTFPRFNADNTVSALDAATFRTAIGAGTGNGSVTSVQVSGGTTGLSFSGGPITTTGTITMAGTLNAANGGTGLTALGSGVATWLGTPSSANLAAAVTDETGSGALVFGTSPTLTTPKATSTIGVGNATPSASGAGISFPATQSQSSDVNTLDDYEEGTWNPQYDTTNGNLTGFSYYTGVTKGTYTKIGNIVTVYAQLATTGAAGITGTGNIIVKGLPFALDTTMQNGGISCVALTSDSRFTNNPSFGQANSGGTTLTLFKTSAMNTANAMTVADMAATNTTNFNIVSFWLTYRTPN